MVALELGGHEFFSLNWRHVSVIPRRTDRILHKEAILLSQRDVETLLLLLDPIRSVPVENVLADEVVDVLQVFLLGSLLLIHEELERRVGKFAIK